jgi:hypothetical protein
MCLKIMCTTVPFLRISTLYSDFTRILFCFHTSYFPNKGTLLNHKNYELGITFHENTIHKHLFISANIAVS